MREYFGKPSSLFQTFLGSWILGSLCFSDSGTHIDYLFQLEQIGDLIDIKSLTLDALIMHLFREQADCEMPKLCQDILSRKPQGDLSLLRQEIKRTESSVWYGGNGKNQVKVATGPRLCADCNSTTHNKENCWGPCTVCKKHGHRSADCRLKDSGVVAERVQEESGHCKESCKE